MPVPQIGEQFQIIDKRTGRSFNGVTYIRTDKTCAWYTKHYSTDVWNPKMTFICQTVKEGWYFPCPFKSSWGGVFKIMPGQQKLLFGGDR